MTFLSSISRARWPFLEANVPVVVSLMIPLIVPINDVQMMPRLMMAALVAGTSTKSLSRFCESTMLVHFPETLRARGLKKTTDVGPVVGDGSGSLQRSGPGGVGKTHSENTSSIVLILSRLRQRQAAPLKSPATKSMF